MKTTTRIIGLLALSGLIACVDSIAAEPAPVTAIVSGSETTGQREARLAWWREARFGVFLHWGLYSIPGRGEWVQWNEQIPNEAYAKLADSFRPAQFDAAAWAAVVKAAGARYAVFTSRHHDGFALFDDPGNAFTSVATAAKRDFVADYVRAVREAGIRVGLYYSPLDWRFPGYLAPGLYRASAEAMRAQYHRQMQELLSNYGTLDVLWFDGGESDWLSFGGDWNGAKWEHRPVDRHYQGGFDWGHAEVYSSLRRLQPNVLINGRADMAEDFRSREGDKALGDFDAAHPWELCTTIVNGPWGWKPEAPVKSLSSLVQLLVKAAGRDGNFLLNVGPQPDGQIDPAQANRLREIGGWLQRYGESIYGTRGGPYLPGDYGVSTYHDRAVYVHILQWPGKELELPVLPARVLAATRLDGGPVTLAQSGHRLVLSVPNGTCDAIDTIIKLDLDRTAADILPVAPTVP